MNNISSRHSIHNRIFYYCIIAFVFMIPVYGKVLPSIIFLMTLNWLIDGRYLKTLPLLFRDSLRWKTLLFSAIYLVYFAGMIYTTDYGFGWFDLEIKFSLFLFPLIFSTLDESLFDPANVKFILKIFVAGCFIGSLVLLIHSLINKIVYDSYNSFVYSNLSWSFHPSYFAMYLAFAISIIADFLFFRPEKVSRNIGLFLIFLVLFFFVVIILLSSKAGIASMIIITIFYITVLILRKKMLKLSIKLVISAIICFYAAFNFFPYAMTRIAKSREVNEVAEQNSSTAERLTIWKTSLPIIKEHFIFGVGTGDVKDELLKKYKEKNLQFILLHELNAHNQFLQTFIAIGIIGLLVLLAMYFVPAISAIRSEYYLYFVFILLFSVNNLVESMLETQAGVVFYAFFNAFLFWVSGIVRRPVSLPVKET